MIVSRPDIQNHVPILQIGKGNPNISPTISNLTADAPYKSDDFVSLSCLENKLRFNTAQNNGLNKFDLCALRRVTNSSEPQNTLDGTIAAGERNRVSFRLTAGKG